MIRSALFLVLSAFVVLPAVRAQTPAAGQPAAAPACLPAATVEQLPKALDDAISGPGDKDRACLRQLMSADVRLVLVSPSAPPRLLTLDDWIAAMARRGSVAMFEHQVKTRTETFSHIAHLWSTYEIRTTADGAATSRGINSVQAIFDGERWKVIAVLWQPATATDPIPEKYLP